MALRNAFENLSLDSTTQAIRDRLPNALDADGGVKVHVQNKTLLQTPIDITGQGAGTVTIIPAVGGKRIYVVGYSILVDTSCTVRWVRGSSNLTGSMSFGNQGGISENGSTSAPIFWTEIGEALNLTIGIASGTTNIGGRIVYYTE